MKNRSTFILPRLFFFLSLLLVTVFLGATGRSAAQEGDDRVLTETMRRFMEDIQPAQPLSPLGATPCVDGMADIYPCENVDLLSFIPLSTFGSSAGNDSWGWTDPLDGKEYALMGLNDGTGFVDISDPVNPIYLGKLPTHTSPSSWRDIKVYNNYAFIVSEAGGHGMQVFDLTELRNVVNPPVTFSESAHYPGFGNAHNVVINEDSGYAYAVGTQTCSGGLHMVNIQDPLNPTNAGCFSADGYTHDAQCVIYNGPDVEHQEDEICFNSNEDTLTIVDVTNKAAPQQLSKTPYAGSAYTHQGWLTEDHTYFLLDDELDEQSFGHNTRTRIFDVSNLEAPVFVDYYDSPAAAIDHNQYVLGNYTYQANYRAGLRILDITDIANGNLTQFGYFDIYPANDNTGFNGAWSVFPYYESGVVIISGIEQGLFVVKPILEADFFMSAEGTSFSICGDDTAGTTINLLDLNDYTGNVTLSANGLPAGASAGFTPNPVAVPGSSDMAITTSGVTPGTYPFTVEGTDGSLTHDVDMTLYVTDSIPGAPDLVSPADGATDVSLEPTFNWDAVDQAVSYLIEIATDPGFSDIVQSASVPTNEYTATTLPAATTLYWRVTAVNNCGEGVSETWSFTTMGVPPILLVDDDDNSPNVRATYTAALDALDLEYDVWDTANTDNEPSAAQLAPYEVVIWFTGDEFGGFAGPGAATETALGQWLDAGNCLFISSQDYHYDRGLTAFMSNYLGVASVTNDNGDYTSVSGQGVFSGLGPYTLSYPFSDYSDVINPNGTAQLAFNGNNGNGAAISKDGGAYRTTFWVFPWEAIGTAANREVALQAVLDWCGELPAYDVDLSGNQSAQGQPGETVEYTVTVTNNGNVTDTVNLAVSGESWTTTLSVSSVELGPGESTDITVSVEIPGDAQPGDSDTATVTGTSAGNPAESDSMTVTTSVPEVQQTYGVEVSGDASGSGAPGSVVSYEVTITNTGDGSDTFDLTVSGYAWATTISDNSVTLGAGESAVVTVEVSIPGDAADGDMDTVTVTATSTGDPGVSDSHDITTTASTGPAEFKMYLPVILSQP